MKLQDLAPNAGATSTRKRVGRGAGSGLGKTSGRGHKGQNARSGGGVRPGFEGGQNPLYRRVPKRGFNNDRFASEFAIVNLNQLNRFAAGTEVTPELLLSEGILKNAMDGIKILGNGELNVGLTVKAHKFSQSAIEKIQAAGGKTEVI